MHENDVARTARGALCNNRGLGNDRRGKGSCKDQRRLPANFRNPARDHAHVRVLAVFESNATSVEGPSDPQMSGQAGYVTDDTNEQVKPDQRDVTLVVLGALHPNVKT